MLDPRGDSESLDESGVEVGEMGVLRAAEATLATRLRRCACREVGGARLGLRCCGSAGDGLSRHLLCLCETCPFIDPGAAKSSGDCPLCVRRIQCFESGVGGRSR